MHRCTLAVLVIIPQCRAKGAKFFLWTKSRKMSLKQSLSGRLTGMPLRGLKRFSVPGNDRNLPRENGDLIIKQTKLADEGFYSCFPTNHWGSISGRWETTLLANSHYSINQIFYQSINQSIIIDLSIKSINH